MKNISSKAIKHAETSHEVFVLRMKQKNIVNWNNVLDKYKNQRRDIESNKLKEDGKKIGIGEIIK